jgi:hypothetical protein
MRFSASSLMITCEINRLQPKQDPAAYANSRPLVAVGAGQLRDSNGASGVAGVWVAIRQANNRREAGAVRLSVRRAASLAQGAKEFKARSRHGRADESPFGSPIDVSDSPLRAGGAPPARRLPTC